MHGWKYIYMDTVDSTNSEAKRLALNGGIEDTLIHAGSQTAGRGRISRKWESPKGAGVWMTQLFAPHNLASQDAGGAVFLSAAAMCRALRELTGAEVMIKWPNDLVLNGKKICGMLAECGMADMRCAWIALGSGLNLTARALSDGLIYATGIYEETGIMLRPEEIFDKYLPYFNETRDLWQRQGLAPIIQLMRPLSATINREVRVNGEHAFAVDIAPGGELIIRTDDGSLRSVVAGDVSVRGITDYV
jgi:BirA family biotin operon repressor/biotin-[acetyl-CoA-carboxylase] ligase